MAIMLSLLKSAVCPPVVVFLNGWNASQQPIYVYENKAKSSLESFSRECVWELNTPATVEKIYYYVCVPLIQWAVQSYEISYIDVCAELKLTWAINAHQYL